MWMNANQGVIQVTFAAIGATIALAASARRYYRRRRAGPSNIRRRRALLWGRPKIPTIAVLPFANVSSDSEQEHLADAITEDLITLFANTPDIEACARNSVFAFKGKAVDVRDIGASLGATIVLEGSLRKAGNLVRITAQLIDTKTGNHIWAQRRDEELREGLDLQDKAVKFISQGVLSEIKGPIASDSGQDWSHAAQLRTDLPPVQYAHNGQHNIAYSVMGSGPPDIVLIMGIASHIQVIPSSPLMGAAMDTLGEKARLIWFDKRGQGLSDPIFNAVGMEEEVEDLAAVIEANNCGKVFLMGISEGGGIAIKYAETYPDKVAGLAVLGCVANLTENDDIPNTFSREQILSNADRWGSGRFSAFAFGGEDTDNDPSFKSWAKLVEQLSATPHNIRAQMEMVASMDIRELATRVTVPTLVMHWTKDLLVPIDQGKFLADHIPGARFLPIEGRAHATFDKEGRIVAALLDFIDQNRDQKL